jgi:hypothetical protein
MNRGGVAGRQRLRPAEISGSSSSLPENTAGVVRAFLPTVTPPITVVTILTAPVW